MVKKRILVAGLGLIGGSIAKAIKSEGKHTIIGYDVNGSSLEFSVMNEIIDKAYTDFTAAAKDADIIILSAPITETIKLMKALNEITFNHQVIVTDTASVKGSIIETAEELINERISFIGGHPMAGSHKRGVEAAKVHLFENAIYILSPSIRSTPEMVDLLKNILTPLKSKFVVLKSEEHDEMTGVVSHFPHLIASSLVHQAKKWEETHAYLPKLAAGGFRDITRIASSNPLMWQDIFYHNSGKLSVLLEEWITEMSYLKELVDKNEKNRMVEYLDAAKLYRDGIPEKTRGAIPAFYDLYVDIRDQKGAIAKVVQLLADINISIKNIQILEVREGIDGALRLSFNSRKDQECSKNHLEKSGYDTTIQE
ncbi:prephenate dehydrogenase [Oceanobacillus sp. CAU 1775]